MVYTSLNDFGSVNISFGYNEFEKDLTKVWYLRPELKNLEWEELVARINTSNLGQTHIMIGAVNGDENLDYLSSMLQKSWGAMLEDDEGLTPEVMAQFAKDLGIGHTSFDVGDIFERDRIIGLGVNGEEPPDGDYGDTMFALFTPKWFIDFKSN